MLTFGKKFVTLQVTTKIHKTHLTKHVFEKKTEFVFPIPYFSELPRRPVLFWQELVCPDSA